MQTNEQGDLSTILRRRVWRSTRTIEARLESTRSREGSAEEETAKVLGFKRRGGNFQEMDKIGITP
jgi:hypothetical protein